MEILGRTEAIYLSNADKYFRMSKRIFAIRFAIIRWNVTGMRLGTKKLVYHVCSFLCRFPIKIPFTHRIYRLAFRNEKNLARILRHCRLQLHLVMMSRKEFLKLSDEQRTVFTADFEARLPEYLRNAPYPKATAA